ncbi:MAG: glutamine-hydrolyzing GMP synthase [bacterium]
MNRIQILIVDYGSQYTLVIGRTLRELGVRSVILPPNKVDKWLKHNTPKAVILSGSNWSVHNEGAPGLPRSLDVTSAKYSILGICYGMQLLAYKFGGLVERPLTHREYGPALVTVERTHPLFNNIEEKTEVWASHGDTVIKLPKGFISIATSGGIAAMSNKNNRVLGIQFHPEVIDTKEGKKILQNFLNISGCQKDWNPINLIHEIQKEVLDVVNKSSKKNVILGVSGGVDSTTLAAVLAPVLGTRLICIAIDTGGLRANELAELKANITSAFSQGRSLRKLRKNLVIIKAEKEFIKNIGTTIDGEEKRAKFRNVYQKIFVEQIAKHKAGFIVQGTLATDIIESGKVGESAMIKTHHNVNLKWGVKDLHPFRNLFKYEVRELARALKLPSAIYERNPFPGPGLFLRVVGTPVSKENIEMVREADKTVTDILKKHNFTKNISQLIVALLGINSVGVKGDERVYGHSLAVRAVQTADFMTAKGYYFPPEVVDEITNALTKHKNIVRVFFDMTPKPPATTEFE